MKNILTALSICLLVLAPVSEVLAKGGGGGRGGGIGRSVSRPSTPKPSVAPRPAATPKPVAAKPATKVSEKPVVSATGKKMNGTGMVVDANNRPTFRGGYQPPVGSTVYYPQRDFLDYLPWIFLFTQDSHREVVVESKGENGETKQETHQEEGVDTMYLWNWVFSIALLGGLILFIMSLLSRKKTNVKSSNRSW